MIYLKPFFTTFASVHQQSLDNKQINEVQGKRAIYVPDSMIWVPTASVNLKLTEKTVILMLKSL